MPYTVWIDGIRIGETTLELRHGADRRAGVFHPTELGLPLLPGITAMGPALLDAGRMARERGIHPDESDLDVDGAVEKVFETPEGDRVLAAARQIARLELHGPSGELVPWEAILITDLDELAAAAGRCSSAEARRTTGGGDMNRVRYFISARFSRADPAARPGPGRSRGQWMS